MPEDVSVGVILAEDDEDTVSVPEADCVVVSDSDVVRELDAVAETVAEPDVDIVGETLWLVEVETEAVVVNDGVVDSEALTLDVLLPVGVQDAVVEPERLFVPVAVCEDDDDRE